MDKQLEWVSDQEIAKLYPEMTVGFLACQCFCVAQSAKDWESPWTVEMFEQTILLPTTRFLFLFKDEMMIGFLIGRAVADECDIYFVAVIQSEQGKGYAKEMVRRFIVDQYDRDIRHFYLEVRVSNLPAQAVYHEWKFTIDSRLKNYYHHPKEDAYKMSLHFSENE